MKSEWDIESAIATYNVEGWGEGYFTVNGSGNVEAQPLKDDGGSIDLLEVVNEARARSISCAKSSKRSSMQGNNLILDSRRAASQNSSPRLRCRKAPRL